MGHLLRVCVLLAVTSSSAFAVSSKEPSVPVKVKLDVSHAPIVEAEIVDARWRPYAGDVHLRVGVNGPAVSSQNLRTFVEAGPRTAIAFVMNGSQIWTDHALGAFEQAVDAIKLSLRVPANSEFLIVTYATGTKIRAPLSPISQLSGASFGSAKDYEQQVGDDLVAGIQLATEELERSNAPVKLMILVGDGADSDREHAQQNFEQLKRRLDAADIQVVALVAKTVVSPAEWDVRALVTKLFLVEGGAPGFRNMLEYYVTRLTDRFYATFDVSTLPVFTGRELVLNVEMPGKPLVPVTVRFPAAASEPSCTWASSSWLQACAAISLLAMLAAFMRSLARE